MRPHPILAGLALVFVFGAQVARGQSVQCPTQRKIVYIEKGVNDTPGALMAAVSVPNNEVLLAPDVDIDFSSVTNPAGSEEPLLTLARCVILASYQPQEVVALNARASKSAASQRAAAAVGIGGGEITPTPGSGRTPSSPGPVLRYGTNPKRSPMADFIEIPCSQDNTAPTSSEGARILGFRVFGPNFNDHQTSEIGINIVGCYDVEVANMEVAGWGGSAIRVDDLVHFNGTNPTQAPANILVVIHDNYIHHNQHSTSGGHALGYGVVVSDGAFAEIYQNVFDYNRHSITASGNAGGYNAIRNLLLKGGGFHNGLFERDIHIMDVHGTESCPNIPTSEGTVGGAAAGAGAGVVIGGLIGGPIGGLIGGIIGGIVGGVGGYYGSQATHTLFNCGDAGFQFYMEENSFQYNKTTDLKIRGKPRSKAVISANIFARATKDDAIQLETQDNVTVTGSNFYNDDTFGQYGVCDVDGDGVDDLVLMTGVTWWYSSSGIYPWSYLKQDPAVLKDVKLGDFDGDGRCDVLKDGGNGNWMIASGATADWKLYGNYLAPLNVVAFGRFDPASPDTSPGIRRPTHAFWRGDGGFWFVTPLTQPGGWTLVQTSSFPFSSLRFGDFTGDGVTDVLANEANHWAISNAARGSWQKLNPTLNDPVEGPYIFIANMDATDNIDDILKLDVPVVGIQGTTTLSATWMRSTNGTTPWNTWKSYAYTVDGDHFEDYVPMGFAEVGHFRGGPGATALTIDPNRIGHFFSPAQSKDRQEWLSAFAY